MRRLIGRWIAIVAVVAGVSVGASALPASAAAPDSGTTTSISSFSTSTPRGVQPADWWVG